MDAKHLRITDAEWEHLRIQFGEHHYIEDMPDGVSDYVMCICEECDTFRQWWVTTQWSEWMQAQRAQSSIRALAESFVDHMNSGKDPQEWLAERRAETGEDVSATVKEIELPGMYL